MKQMLREEDRKNVMFYIADYGGVGSLRTIFPNLMLNSKYFGKRAYAGTISTKLLGEIGFIRTLDYIRFQRQVEDSQLEYIRILNKLKNEGQIKTKLIYDLDDWIVDLPDFNWCKYSYTKEKCLPALKELLMYMDIFTVSTTYLKNKLNNIKPPLSNCKIEVVPNLLPKWLYDYDRPWVTNKKPKIIWAGSPTHFSATDKENLGDLAIIYDLVKNTKDEIDWVFMGGCPEKFKHFNIEVLGWNSMFDFPRVLRELGADFGIAPLLKNEFNRCKSNIKLLDYWASGLIPICSKLEPYKESPLFFSGDWKKDRDLIFDIFNDSNRFDKLIDYGYKKVSKYWLEDNLKYYTKLFKLKGI